MVNPGHPLAEGFEPSSLSPALPGSDILLESECAAALTALVRAVGGEGKIIPVSGYRPHAEQLALWEETLRARGEEFTRKYVAIPGCSEHETGLAIDLALDTGGEIDFIRPYFPYDGVCGEFRAKAAEYGFIAHLRGALALPLCRPRARRENRRGQSHARGIRRNHLRRLS